MSKCILSTLPAILVCAIVSNALADDGIPSSQTLDEMGLSNIQILPDSDSIDIRGYGYRSKKKARVEIWGESEASVGGKYAEAESENGYHAEGSHRADGKNESYASIRVSKKRSNKYSSSYKGHKKSRRKSSSKSISVKVKAGGSSSAHAH